MITTLRCWLLVAGMMLGLAACSTMDVAPSPGLAAGDRLAVLPLVNYTETPEAGLRASSIAYGILQVQGHGEVLQPTDSGAQDPLFGDPTGKAQAADLEWARQADARYALAGSVHEWRYKVGVDGEPAVGLSFKLIDLDSGTTIWTATGSRSSWSRSSLATVAQDLIRSLLAPLRVAGR